HELPDAPHPPLHRANCWLFYLWYSACSRGLGDELLGGRELGLAEPSEWVLSLPSSSPPLLGVGLEVEEEPLAAAAAAADAAPDPPPAPAPSGPWLWAVGC